MKKWQRVVSGILCAVTLFSLASCGETEGQGFELSHFDGSQTENGYDTDLLYKNNSNLLGGDSGVIWVSKEQSEEYGGYFYQYQSSTQYVINEAPKNQDLSGVPSTEEGETASSKDNASYVSHIATTRSKDLNDWELCGAVDNGLSLKLSPDCWIYTYIWSPEVVYDSVSKKYFMYFNAGTQRDTKHFYLQAAISDTPVGPFELVTSENYYGDANATNLNGEVLTDKKPMIDFKSWYGLEQEDPEYEYVADAHPMIDENGDLYLYFVKRCQTPIYGLTCWGMKMKDFATPDYSTLTCLMYSANANGSWAPVRSIYKGNKANNAPITSKDEINDLYFNDPACPRYLSDSWDHRTDWEDGTENTKKLANGLVNPDYNGYIGINSGVVREGIQIIRHKDKQGKTVYYATFTMTGVGSPDYDVHWAYSYSPLGVTGDEYTLPKGRDLGLILGVDASNEFMSNMGHVQFLNVDGEWWIAHWEWTVPFGYTTSTDIGRIYAVTPMTWIEDARVDFYVPVANGPSKNLQALPSVYTGYRNIAPEAEIAAEGAKGLQYLNDGHVVTMFGWQARETECGKSTTITITFAQPRSIRGILIYNSYFQEYAFKEISNIRFSLAETPAWRKGGEETECYINHLGFSSEKYQAGSAAIATFNEIKVNKITITIDKALQEGNEIRLSDIQILGK